MGRVSPPFSLVQNRTDDFGASFAHLRRSALQPPPQCTATAPAVHCNHPCSALHPPGPYLVYFKRKYMRTPRITFATADANVINRGCKRYKPLPQTFAGKGAHLGIPSPHGFSNEPLCCHEESYWRLLADLRKKDKVNLTADLTS